MHNSLRGLSAHLMRQKTVKALDVHANQWNAVKEIANFFDKGWNNVLCKAECMSGKTGTAAVMGLLFKNYYSNCNVVFILNQSSVSNKEQTKYDFGKITGLKSIDVETFNLFPEILSHPGQCLILHSNDLSIIDIERFRAVCKNSPTLILNDEVHYGIGTGGRVMNFFEKLGATVIKWPESEEADGYEILSIKGLSGLRMVQFSATPFSHTLRKDLPVVRLENGKGYCSISQMIKGGRIVDHGNAKIFDTKTEHLSEEFVETLKSEISKNGVGYYIVRVKSREVATRMETQILKGNLLGDVSFAHVHANGSNDKNLYNDFSIEMFQKVVLSQPPPHQKPTVTWICGAMAMGAQIKCDYIKMIWEPRALCVDTYFQRIGRSCGYGKGKFTYKIYCDLEMVEYNLDNYETGDAPLKHSSTNTAPPFSQFERIILFGGTQKEVELKAKKYLGKNQRFKFNTYLVSSQGSEKAEKPNDLIRDIYHKSIRAHILDKFSGVVTYRITHFDAPCPHFPLSWEKVTKDGRQGQFAMVVEDTNAPMSGKMRVGRSFVC